MKFLSLQKLLNTALRVLRRFPCEILSALTGTIAAIFVVELESTNRGTENIFIRLIMAAEISLLLNFAATLFSKDKKLEPAKKLMLRLASIFLAVLLFFLLHPEEKQSDYVRFFLLALSFHLLVAFAAFTGKNRINAFWQFNKTLFLRILTSALYSTVLFLGISAAIAAMNFLFGFKFEWDTYLILWIWIVGLFNTIFFLAAIPENFTALEQDNSYPKSLKLFTQYVLIPLASVYVLILLAYEIKILLEWHLPKGLVSNLILSYAVFGILSLLLVFPIKNLDENKWLKTYSRYFYFLLIPLLLLLFIAVGTRVSRYGVTENRYFLILLAAWLLFITIYFLVSKKQNIKLIPISLGIVTLLSIYGPQSAFSIAEQSQRKILLSLFKKYHAVFNGKISRMPNNVSAIDGNRAVATLEYLIKHYDFSSINSLFSKNQEAVADSLGRQKNKNDSFKIGSLKLKETELDWAKAALGLEKFSGYGYQYDDTSEAIKMNTFYSISAINPQLTVVKGYDYSISAVTSQDSTHFDIDNYRFSTLQNYSQHYFSLKINDLEFNFKAEDILKHLLKQGFNLNQYKKEGSGAPFYTIPANRLSTLKTLNNFTVSFQITFISYTNNGKGKIEIQSVTGNYLIKKKF